MASGTLPVSAALRKKVLKVLFISLLLDLVRHPMPPLVLHATRLTGVDIIHLHPAPVPQAHRVLPQSRDWRPEYDPLQDPRGFECIQELVCEADQFALRHCPARRRTRLALLDMPGRRIASDWHFIRQIWQTHSASVVNGRQHPQRCALGRSNRLQDIPR